MKIALIGYGKMGHILEKVAKERGHEIVCVIDCGEEDKFKSDEFRSADCAIEFSTPSSAVNNIKNSFLNGVPVVCGTTGWTDAMPEIKALCDAGKGTFLFSSNFSLGVNIFMALNRYLARLMEKYPEYVPHMVETHHIHKLDHPSGTAITLADEIIDENSRINGWKEPGSNEIHGADSDKSGIVMEIDHIRSGEIPGIHTIDWVSDVDSITITHSAKNREGFGIGAVMGAEWLANQKGFHKISEVFRF